jgi:hypothetical protein
MITSGFPARHFGHHRDKLGTFFEYCLQVPANRIGYAGNGGPFNLWQLKVIQEVITLVVFTVFAILVFKNEQFRWNHGIGFAFLVAAVYFIFKK